MNGYTTKDELVAAYARTLELGGMPDFAARDIAADRAVYVPHLYRGGWVVRGFGYSTERVGKYVTPETCGNPLTV
jgi:hypothetical protein